MKSFILCALLLLSVFSSRGLGASLKSNEMIAAADQVSEPRVEDSNILESLLRTKRHSHISTCTYCCKCCKNKGCGYCCRT